MIQQNFCLCCFFNFRNLIGNHLQMRTAKIFSCFTLDRTKTKLVNRRVEVIFSDKLCRINIYEEILK
ncbi:CLUMA_CG004609, isoform A [Clunio marinus]|uniref:CLUMA_CG004609, isoform A n=1 Tax=Clunio marinus TaxID=568069 RepID=A0A1J1HS58_9DIPT|nr:CLUMA_CG004609, isoform A [Clunio marinus]